MIGYSIDGYCRMMADDNRVAPYLEALAAAVQPDSVVFDIGAGTGYFSIAACELGAARVYAIEPDRSLDFARAEAMTRGLTDRIEFVRRLSTDFEPEQPADVIIFDLRGIVPIFAGNVSATLDAATRLLKPGGVMIPRRDLVYAALIEAERDYHSLVDPWVDDPKLPWRACVEANANTTFSLRLGADAVLTNQQLWHEIEYGVTRDESASGEFTLTATRAGAAHGIAVWFESEMAAGIGFSTAPGRSGTVYGQMFLPFVSPIHVQPGDTAACVIRATPSPEGIVWSWSVEVVRGGVAIGRNEQSTFNRFRINRDALLGAKMNDVQESPPTSQTMTARYAKTEQVLSCEVAGETVLLSLEDGIYFGLNKVGTHIWREISPAVTVADLRASMLEHFEVDEATCERDLLALIGQLETRKLIILEPAPV